MACDRPSWTNSAWWRPSRILSPKALLRTSRRSTSFITWTAPRLAPSLENAIYRIVQESLTNARRYSQSQRVLVRLTRRDRYIRHRGAGLGHWL